MEELKKNQLFSLLPEEELRNLEQCAEELSFKTGEAIFKEGDPGNGVYVIKSGCVQISGLLPNREPRVFTRLEKGDVFGEMTLFDEAPRSAGASAETDTTLYFIPREPLVAMLQRVPSLVVTLVQEISNRLREFNHQYVAQMIQAERMSLVGRFASSIIHDLKNPLTIIAMAARTAGREESTLQERAVAEERINKQVDRITALVNDILEFVRGTATSVALCQVHYGEFLENVCRELQLELEAKGMNLIRETSAPDVSLRLNPKRLTRVLINLVDNAMDAMPNGGNIKLRCREEDAMIITEVEDEGPGIPMELETKLFEAFTTFGKTNGTGLGLAICRRIIEEHGGTINVRNGPGGGAIFRFSLPIPS